ncbi:MAG: metal ABC transporter permease [Candidatus Odinarchaeota archaeon]|nr:metal ABC transporter permease [Candidatus Odinarchaeota archaeon]
MIFMTLLFIEALIAALLAGSLCGVLGTYLRKLGLLTLCFTVAHAALAGAAFSILFSTSPELTAFSFSVIAAFIVEILYYKVGIEREIISMCTFSLSSALAMFAIYMTPSVTLTSETASLILWGSILAATPAKIILLTFLSISLIIYILSFKLEIDTLLFDIKLAEAEGVNIQFHSTVLLVLTAIAISIILKLTGGFLVFALLFNPIAAVERLSYKRQPLLGGIVGGISGIIGVVISYVFDTPIGATIAVTASLMLITGVSISSILEYLRKKNLKTALNNSNPYN